MVVLGLDPGLATIGYAFLDGEKILDFGVIRTSSGAPFSDRLHLIHQELSQLIEAHRPEFAAVEQIFFSTNAKTAIDVAQARGVLMACLAQYGVHSITVTPNQVKQSLTGDGHADKFQIQTMLMRIFRLDRIPHPDDAADALALAYCASILHSVPG